MSYLTQLKFQFIGFFLFLFFFVLKSLSTAIEKYFLHSDIPFQIPFVPIFSISVRLLVDTNTYLTTFLSQAVSILSNS